MTTTGGDRSYPADTGGAGTTTHCVRPPRRVSPNAITPTHRLRPFIVSSPPRPCISDGGHVTRHGQDHRGTPIHQPLEDSSAYFMPIGELRVPQPREAARGAHHAPGGWFKGELGVPAREVSR